MKRCPYCGAEYVDAVTRCPIDEEALVDPVQTESASKAERREAAYNVPALEPGQRKEGWATILSPHDRLEGQIVVGRLQAGGIRARLSDSVIGGWIGRNVMSFVQVRVEDYDKARKLLNGA